MSVHQPLAIGIDIGGTGTKFGIVDKDGNVLFSGEMSTKKHKEHKVKYYLLNGTMTKK